VIGLTGVGKSSIIKTLTGSDVHVEHSISAGMYSVFMLCSWVLSDASVRIGTTTFAMFPTIIDDQRYILIDTPGFNDENRSDVDIFQEILAWFECMTPYCDLAGILYVHDITPPRFDGAAKLNLEMLQALCGEEFYMNVTVVTTKWGILSESAIKQAAKRQKQFESGPWKDLIAGGTRVFQHRKGVVEEEEDLDDAPPTKEEVREREEKYEEARRELCNMMAYYKTSATVKPTIQRELRRKVGMLDTKAGSVLRKHLNLPPTPDHINSDGNSVPSTPSCWTADDGLSLQLQQSALPGTLVHVVHHHCATPTPPGSSNKGRKEKDEKPKMLGWKEEEKTQKSGWWANMWRAIRAFFFLER
jgi:GTP-binding protein EngB required for normal cell division